MSSNSNPASVLERLYTRVMSGQPQTTRGLENQYIYACVTEIIPSLGFGTLSEEQKANLLTLKTAISNALKTAEGKSEFGNEIASEFLSQGFRDRMLEIAKNFTRNKASNVDVFLATELQGGKRGRKTKSKKSKKSKSKKTKSRVRKH